jgi:Asp/Glu/hydantoin racemase
MSNGSDSQQPLIGILGWEAGSVDTLAQLEKIPGNIAHPETFDFPVDYERITGAHYQTVVVQPNAGVLAAMVDAARAMERRGIRAILTSCGFNAVFQRELASAVDVPVFASALLQVPLVHRMLKPDQCVGIITAAEEHLTTAHLTSVGITEEIPICITGLENSAEFSRILADPKAEPMVDELEVEVIELARRLVAENQGTGAIVLECTDLPPFAAALRRALRLPVFDIVSLANWVYESICGDRWNRSSNL